MRSITLVLLVAMFISLDVFGLEIIYDGETYQCEKIDTNSGVAADSCANLAYSGPFSTAQSIELCKGANSIAPAECAIKAYSGPFNTTQALELCKKAQSIGPVECAIDAYSGPFNTNQAIELCKLNGTLARSKCARQAYAGPYSTAESIDLCKGSNANLIIKSLQLLKSSNKSNVKFYDI